MLRRRRPDQRDRGAAWAIKELLRQLLALPGDPYDASTVTAARSASSKPCSRRGHTRDHPLPRPSPPGGPGSEGSSGSDHQRPHRGLQQSDQAIKRVGCGYRNQANYERRILLPSRPRSRVTAIAREMPPSSTRRAQNHTPAAHQSYSDPHRQPHERSGLSRVPPVHQSAVHSPPRPNRRLAAAAQMRPPPPHRNQGDQSARPSFGSPSSSATAEGSPTKRPAALSTR